MPFVRISIPNDLVANDVAHISNAVHDAMVKTFNVPPADRFQVIDRQAPDELVCASEYLGIHHTGPVVMIQITCNEGRTLEMKKNLYESIALKISANLAMGSGKRSLLGCLRARSSSRLVRNRNSRHTSRYLVLTGPKQLFGEQRLWFCYCRAAGMRNRWSGV
jgi:4-oxalocrotonate tautomerase